MGDSGKELLGKPKLTQLPGFIRHGERFMIIDIHCHYIPQTYFDFVENKLGYRILNAGATDDTVDVQVGPLTYKLNKTFFDPALQIVRMNRLEIDRAVISLATPLINYGTPNHVAIEAAQLFNDELASLIASHPDRLDGWAMLPVQAPEAAAKELERGVNKLGLRGGHIGSNVNGRYLDRPEFSPIFDAAVRLGVPLFMHPTNPPGRERMEAYELAVVSGYLFDTTLSIFNMIFGGLLDRYPSLKLCCAHAGGYALTLRGRMQREVDTNPRLSGIITRSVGEYLKRLYYDTICFEPAYLRYVADIVGLDHLLLASDGPFPLAEPDPVRFVCESFLDNDSRSKILGSNAVKLLNLS